MNAQSEQEKELAELIIETLNLEDVRADEIQPDDLLFGDGLGLDSIDALELVLAISQKYGVQLKADDEYSREAFATLRSLNLFVQKHST
jgi:acyl carrier protein